MIYRLVIIDTNICTTQEMAYSTKLHTLDEVCCELHEFLTGIFGFGDKPVNNFYKSCEAVIRSGDPDACMKVTKGVKLVFVSYL